MEATGRQRHYDKLANSIGSRRQDGLKWDSVKIQCKEHMVQLIRTTGRRLGQLWGTRVEAVSQSKSFTLVTSGSRRPGLELKHLHLALQTALSHSWNSRTKTCVSKGYMLAKHHRAVRQWITLFHRTNTAVIRVHRHPQAGRFGFQGMVAQQTSNLYCVVYSHFMSWKAAACKLRVCLTMIQKTVSFGYRISLCV